MASEPLGIRQRIHLGEGVEFDPTSDELYRGGRVFKLERIPATVLLFLIEKNGEVVRREEIVERVWGKNVFLDTDNGINSAIRKIRQALKDDPESPRFIQTLSGKGYRFIAPVIEHSPSAVLLETPIQAPHRIAAPLVDIVKPSSNRRHIIALTLLLGAVTLAYTLWSRGWTRSSPPPSRVMLAVLPFTNLTGDSSQDYFSDGLTEEMITELGRLNPERLGVIGRTSIMLYKNNPKSLNQVGRELGVQYVVEGSVRRDADHVRITAQLIRLKDQTHVWAGEYDRELKSLLTLQTEISGKIKNEVELALGTPSRLDSADAQQPASAATTSYEAFDFYLKGRYFWNKRTAPGLQQAASYFEGAIAKDPHYARAYSGLADTYALMSTWEYGPQNVLMPKARAAVLKALEIDPTLAEAHASLALIAENYDYDWQTAEKEFRRSIELNPDYATAHQWYAEYLSFQGRLDEALSESERARLLEPLSLIIAADHAVILYYSRQYDRAIAQSRLVTEMDPNFPRAPTFLWAAYMQEGRFAEAKLELERTHPPAENPWTWASYTYLYGRWGRSAEAEHAFAKFKQLAPKLEFARAEATLLAYSGLGKKDQAMALLERSYSEHSNLVIRLKVDPICDTLRGDARFQDLLRRLKLAQ